MAREAHEETYFKQKNFTGRNLGDRALSDRSFIAEFSHSDPSVFSGHSLAGISCQLTFVEAKSDSLDVYELSEAVQEKATGSVFTCYEVTHTVGILYFAKAQGQA